MPIFLSPNSRKSLNNSEYIPKNAKNTLNNKFYTFSTLFLKKPCL